MKNRTFLSAMSVFCLVSSGGYAVLAFIMLFGINHPVIGGIMALICIAKAFLGMMFMNQIRRGAD